MSIEQSNSASASGTSLVHAKCPACGKGYNLPARKIGRRAKCGCGTEFVIEPTIPPPAARGIEIVENPPIAHSDRALANVKLMGIYTAQHSKGLPGGRMSLTADRVMLHKFDQLRFFMIGPFLALLPPIHRWITRKALYQFPLTDLIQVTDASPRSHSRLRLELADGAWFELRLSKLGKGRLVERCAARVDAALQQQGPMRLQRTSNTQWQVIGRQSPLPMAIIEPAKSPDVSAAQGVGAELPVAVAEYVEE